MDHKKAVKANQGLHTIIRSFINVSIVDPNIQKITNTIVSMLEMSSIVQVQLTTLVSHNITTEI